MAESPRPRRKRITPQQLSVLTEMFDACSTPSFEVRELVASTLKMTNREVQVWCQNRRSKVTRAQQDPVPAHPSGPIVRNYPVLYPSPNNSSSTSLPEIHRYYTNYPPDRYYPPPFSSSSSSLHSNSISPIWSNGSRSGSSYHSNSSGSSGSIPFASPSSYDFKNLTLSPGPLHSSPSTRLSSISQRFESSGPNWHVPPPVIAVRPPSSTSQLIRLPPILPNDATKNSNVKLPSLRSIFSPTPAPPSQLQQTNYLQTRNEVGVVRNEVVGLGLDLELQPSGERSSDEEKGKEARYRRMSVDHT